jgi:hypothetical protein
VWTWFLSPKPLPGFVLVGLEADVVASGVVAGVGGGVRGAVVGG